MSHRYRYRVRGPAVALLAAAALAICLSVLALGAPDSSSIRDLEAEIAGLDARASAASQERESAAAQARANLEAIGQNNRDIRDVAAARASAQERLSERLVSVYTTEPITMAQIVLTASSLSEAIEGYRIQEDLARSDVDLSRRLGATSRRLTSLRSELAEEKAARAAALAESDERLAEVRGLVRARRVVLDQARAALAAADAEARAARLAADQQARERAAAAGQTSVAAPPSPPAPSPAEPAAGSRDAGIVAHLARIAQCESGGNPKALSSSGLYRGKYQFDIPTWESVGGSGDPIDATEAEQDLRAQILYERRGPGPWPVCGA